MSHHDLLLELSGLKVAGQREESLAHVGCIVQVSKSFEQRNHTEKLPIAGVQAELFLREVSKESKTGQIFWSDILAQDIMVNST